MKAVEQYFHVVLFIMLYKVVLTFQLVDETVVCRCNHLNELLSSMCYGTVNNLLGNHSFDLPRGEDERLLSYLSLSLSLQRTKEFPVFSAIVCN